MKFTQYNKKNIDVMIEKSTLKVAPNTLLLLCVRHLTAKKSGPPNHFIEEFELLYHL